MGHHQARQYTYNGVPEEGTERKGETLFNEITENSQNLMKHLCLHMQEALLTSRRINANPFTSDTSGQKCGKSK